MAVHAVASPIDLEAWRTRDLPPAPLPDRLALRLGLALILWGRRHSAPADRAALAERRRRRLIGAAALAARDAAEARRLIGGQIV